MTQDTLKDETGEGQFGMAWPIVIAIVLAVVLVGGVGGWAATARLNSAVIATGVVKVDRELRLAQHATGGAIESILVAPGETVEEGQVLARLDQRETMTELSLIERELLDLRVRAARLEAERDFAADMVLPDAFDLTDPAVAGVVLGERRTFRDRRYELLARREMLALRLERAKRTGPALLARLDALDRQVQLASAEMDRNGELVQRGVLAENRLGDQEALVVRLQGDRASIEADIEANAIEQREIETEIADLDQAFRWDAHRQLREIEPRIAELELRSEQARLRIDRADIRAPVAGVVNEVRVNTVGQVLPAGETLASIVPRGARLVVEFRVETVDVDQVEAGQPTRLRFLAFDQRKTPELAGEITYLASASVTDQATGLSYFVATAEPVEEALPDAGIDLVPGMPVEVYIQTGARTPLGYIMQPLRDGLLRAMAEG